MRTRGVIGYECNANRVVMYYRRWVGANDDAYAAIAVEPKIVVQIRVRCVFKALPCKVQFSSLIRGLMDFGRACWGT